MQTGQTNYSPPLTSEQKRALESELTQQRKIQHIEICQTQDVEASDRYHGFDHVQLQPCALPDANWDDLDTRQSFLGYQAQLPFLITGMTGGVERGAEINRRLAEAAAVCGIPMGVGSQRLAIEDASLAEIFQIRTHVPNVFLIANLGIAQMSEPQSALDMARRAIDMIEANAIAIHLNLLQELVQIEGDREFAGRLDVLAYLQDKLDVPLIIKEVGGGLDLATAHKLVTRGIRCLDVGGRGGTSWSFIESKRTTSVHQKAVGEVFRDWGIPTAQSLAQIANLFSDKIHDQELTLIATGGIRDGLTVAKAVGMGATTCGIGLPLFKAALESTERVIETIQIMEKQLKIAMMASDCRSLADLPQRLRLKDETFKAIAERVARTTSPTLTKGTHS